MEWTQNNIQQELTRFLAGDWLDGEGGGLGKMALGF